LQQPRLSGVICFDEVPLKAYFGKELRENQILTRRVVASFAGVPQGITSGNPPLSAATKYVFCIDEPGFCPGWEM